MCSAFVCAALAIPARAPAGEGAAQRPHELSAETDVHLATTCSPGAAPAIDRGVALLYAVELDAARASFAQAAGEDEGCAMAYWGIAMTHRGSPWDAARTLDRLAGSAALQKAFELAPPTTRELDYLHALEAFFAPAHPDLAWRFGAFEKGMQELHERYPRDLEAAALYAMAALEVQAVSGDAPEPRRRWATQALAEVLASRPAHAGALRLMLRVYGDPAEPRAP